MTLYHSFDDFFASGQKEYISPFLKPSSRRWGEHLSFKVSILSAFFLVTAFITSFFISPLSSIFLLLIYFLSGTQALLSAIEHIQARDINIDVLMTLGAFAAALMGYPLDGALLLVLFSFSESIEERVQKRAQDALFSLSRLTPQLAYCISQDGSIQSRAIQEIEAGARLLVKAGDIVPLDGILLETSALLDLSHLTGESHPVAKKPGDEIIAGARAIDCSLAIEVLRSAADSTLQRIAMLIIEAKEAKPKIQQLFERFGKTYSSIVIAITFFVALALPWLANASFLGDGGSLYRALAFLIAASPCALIIATPTAYLSALSSCAKKGIVLKGGIVLDALTRCKNIAFDKTGTLTTGELQCIGVDIMLSGSLSKAHAIAIAAALEKHASHPIARAIDRFAADNKIDPYKVEEVQVLSGQGIQGRITLDKSYAHVHFGNARWLGIDTKNEPVSHSSADLMIESEGVAHAHFRFHFTDTIRPDAPSLIETLRKRHKKEVWMLTGDRQSIATEIATRLGITRVAADLLPEDKLEHVAKISKNSGLIMMGDGMNDAPALARATVGIALGQSASHTALHAADGFFLQEDLSLLTFLLQKAKRTARIVKQNMGFALGCIAFAAPISLFGDLPIWLAVILHEGGTVLVSLNALRLLKK